MDEIIKAGAKTKVLLLSATPVNNNLRDLRNQVYLITEGRANALEEATQIKDIAQTLKLAQTQFTHWADPKNPNRNVKELIEKLGTDFTKLLDTVTIARSRKHIVKFYDVHAKQVLEMYRLLCSGKTIPYELLCDLFNTETNNGASMEKYSALLKSAVNEISRLFKKRNLQSLTNNRNAQIISKEKQAEETNHFELVTWLVIK